MFIRCLMYILLLPAFSAYATESDNYSDRALILKKANAAPVIEAMVDKLITAAVNEANQTLDSRTPIEKRVIESLRKRLASDSFGVLASIVQSQSPFKVYGVPVTPLEWVLDQQNNKQTRNLRSSGILDLVAHPAMKTIKVLRWGNDFDELLKTDFPVHNYGHRALLEDSIFNKLNIFESGISGMPGIMFVASLNINNSVIGIDKLGHFFAQGYSYYESSEAGRKIEVILKDGKFEEEGPFGKGIFGISTFGSGVVSYADLAANYHGMLFWKAILEGSKPFIRIKDKQAEVVRKFKLADYPLHTWDEAINISSYHGLAAKDIKKSIAKLGYEWDKPIDLKAAKSMSQLNCASYYTSALLKIDSECKELE